MSAPRIATAMVMAAGLGARMRPLTDERPKALIEVGGKALIDHVLDRLADDGVARAVVNVHAFANALEAHLARRTRPEVVISDERAELLETGGGLVKAAPLLGDAPIFVANSDTVWLEDAGAPSALETLRAAWDPARMDALLLLARMDRLMGFDGPGDFHLDAGGRLRRPEPGQAAPYAYMGVQILDPAVLKARPLQRFSTNLIWNDVAARGRLCGVVLAGEWMHVGDPESRDAADARLREAGR